MSIEPDAAFLQVRLRLLTHGIHADPLTTDPVALSMLLWLAEENGYLLPKLISGGRWAAVQPLLATAAVTIGDLDDRIGTVDRWCYHSVGTAAAALMAWDGHGEPEGWHRHPRTGRRLAETEGHFDDDDNPVPVGAIYVRA